MLYAVTGIIHKSTTVEIRSLIAMGYVIRLIMNLFKFVKLTP